MIPLLKENASKFFDLHLFDGFCRICTAGIGKLQPAGHKLHVLVNGVFGAQCARPVRVVLALAPQLQGGEVEHGGAGRPAC